jgi:hypothetical protein
MKRYVEYSIGMDRLSNAEHEYVFIEEPATFKDILSAELKDGSLKGLREELELLILGDNLMSLDDKGRLSPFAKDMVKDKVDAVIALLTKGEQQ